MTLAELFTTKDWQTDKGTLHDYINAYYTSEFEDKRESVKNVLEIGVFNGGSLRLWKEWFKNANITGMDVNMPDFVAQEGIEIIVKDAYSQEAINEIQDDTYDYIIDDGPHTLHSMIIAVKKYLPKVKQGGKLIIEDVQDIQWVNILEEVIDINIASEWNTIDMRSNKGRYDDIIFEIKRK